MKQSIARLLVPTVCTAILATFLFPCVGDAKTCEEWVARVVSVQGSVHTQRDGETKWVPAKLNDTYRPGDMIRVQERSRAEVSLCNEVTLRLDQNSTVTFSGVEKEDTLLIRLLKGVAYFFSRIPRSLKLSIPFVNGVVEGTEFLARVERDQTFLSVFEGRIAAVNEAGDLVLESGQSALTFANQAPSLHMVASPRAAVKWAL